MADSEEKKRIASILVYAVKLWHFYYRAAALENDIKEIDDECTDDEYLLKSLDSAAREKASVFFTDISEKLNGSASRCHEILDSMEDTVRSALRDCRTVIPEVYGKFADQLSDDDIDKIYEHLCDEGFCKAYDYSSEEILFNLNFVLMTAAAYAKAEVRSEEDMQDFYDQFDDVDYEELPFC